MSDETRWDVEMRRVQFADAVIGRRCLGLCVAVKYELDSRRWCTELE